MSQVVRQLLARQLIVRQADLPDKRRQSIRLTPAEQALVATARRERDSWLTATIDQQFKADERHLLAAALPLLQRRRRGTRTVQAQLYSF